MAGWYQLNGHEFEQTPGDGEGQGELMCCSPRGCKELDTTDRLSNNNWNIPTSMTQTCCYFSHFPPPPKRLSLTQGDGTPLQYFCLENPRDGEAWWAAVYGAAQSRTQLKRLSSSSSTLISRFCPFFCPFL